MIPDIIQDTWDFLWALSPEMFLRVFWFFFLFDFPRFVVTDIFVFFYERWQGTRPDKNEQFIRMLKESPPKVSIIIPALNEEDTVAWTIRSLHEQTYRNLEMIIVDDGSEDRTPEICRELVRENDDIRYLRFAERAGKSAVLNYGLRFATGEFVVFVDSDTTFDRDAIFQIITSFADPKVGGVSGNLSVRNADSNLLTMLQTIEYMFTISMGRRVRSLLGTLPIISGAFGAFRREMIMYDRIGGHEPGPGNDSDLAIRVRKQGYKIKFQPKAVCLTNSPVKMYNLIKQRSRWDRNMIKNRIRKHKDTYNPFSKSFRLRELITFMDSLFFHLGLAALTAYYLLDIAWNYPDYFVQLMFVNFCLYFCSELLELILITSLDRRLHEFPRFLMHLPLVNPFKIFLKLVRLKAYLQEFFLRESNRDPFAPIKVRQRYIQW